MYKEKKCKCGRSFKQYKSFDRYCSFECQKKYAKPPNIKLKSIQKPISRVSKKRAVQELQYKADRIIFLSKPENQICPVTGGPTTDVHHKKGRIGDLLLDQRFWLAVSREGHNQIENNPTWAYEMGYSIKRNAKN